MPPSTRKSSELPVVPVVECRDVAKRFYYYEHRTKSLREWFIRTALRKPIHVRHAAFTLSGFSVRIQRGEAVALIGANGGGKSTALRLIAGIYRPSAGSVVTRGRLAAIIELGAGFHRELTGAENVRLYAGVLGVSRRELAARYDEIVAFSGMADFLDVPLKYYSSGMEARLAFSLAVCIEPEILLLDEVLSVGDGAFRERCLDRLRAFIRNGGTAVVVSHELPAVRELCSRAIWLDRGRMRMDGEIGTVVAACQAAMDGSSPARAAIQQRSPTAPAKPSQ